MGCPWPQCLGRSGSIAVADTYSVTELSEPDAQAHQLLGPGLHCEKKDEHWLLHILLRESPVEAA